MKSSNCLGCHSLQGKGGTEAPDLGRRIGRGYSPAEMASLMWNHGPTMWAAFQRKGIRRPELDGQQAADLFAYFFSVGYFDKPGSAKRGRRVFETKRCAHCHGITSPIHPVAKPVEVWQSLADPIALAQNMWNHSREMSSALESANIPYPKLTSQDLTDLLTYLESLPARRDSRTQFSPASPESGAILFQAKGCAACHKGALALEERRTRYSLTEFAAAMWNHPFKMPHNLVPLNYGEMRRLVGYLFSRQFFDERGDTERGREVFAKKRCATCHDDPSSGAPSLSALAGNMTSYGMVAALWKHGPGMADRLRQRNIAWPRIDGREMADLTAYLHGHEFRRRRGSVEEMRTTVH